MADNTSNTNEVLVLNDEQGNLYAIPRDVLESHRVTGEQKEKIEQMMGSDVSGFGMMGSRAAAAAAQGPGAQGPGAQGPGMEGPQPEALVFNGALMSLSPDLMQ